MPYIYNRPRTPIHGSIGQGQTPLLRQIPLEYLPDGAVLEVMVGPIPHQGVLQRGRFGEPLVHHNSKLRGGAVTTPLNEFSEGSPVTVLYIPQTTDEGRQITQSARGDVARGIKWTVADNCQDLVSRAVTGKNGSKTRDAVAVAGLFGFALWLASR